MRILFLVKTPPVFLRERALSHATLRNHIASYSSLADCEGGYHEKRLLHDLLDTYNILERPVVNESDPLQLSFGLTLMQIIDVVRIDGEETNDLMIFWG